MEAEAAQSSMLLNTLARAQITSRTSYLHDGLADALECRVVRDSKDLAAALPSCHALYTHNLILASPGVSLASSILNLHNLIQGACYISSAAKLGGE